MEDFLIPFTITVFMLSLIAERVANFVKLYLQGRTLYIIWPHILENKFKLWLKIRIKILAVKQPTKEAEKQREYRILTINIIVGILVAVLLNANLFQIIDRIFETSTQQKGAVSVIIGWDLNNLGIQQWLGLLYFVLIMWWSTLVFFKHLYENNYNNLPRSKGLVWIAIVLFVIIPLVFIVLPWIIETFSDSEKLYMIRERYFNVVQHILGYIGIGLFLSLGSKFWHDFLDLLLKVKNTRQQLSEEQTFTNYSTADEIKHLAETSRDGVVVKMYEAYRREIGKIKGVVSHGINTVFDKKSRLYKKMIEVEFVSNEAQTALINLIDEGNIVVNNNTFYLKDYTNILYTDTLDAIIPDQSMAISGECNEIIQEQFPVCYAYNNTSKSSLGSFGVIKKDEDNYYAISNLHVFATSQDLKEINGRNNYKIKDENRKVKLVIRGENTRREEFDCEICDDYNFGDVDGDGYDFCRCAITKEAYEKYYQVIKREVLTPDESNHMVMFGATSKFDVKFHSFWSGTYCTISYPDFYKKLYLYKIKSLNKNIRKGDSGSIVYLKDDSDMIINGMLVAKSDNYAYMQIVNI
ncbi:hypothetical protein OU798_02180 [Prolixibacteraceae bacterium Z1-6]|uniref:Uncharacterized protein n=1 Tax=Draconibacterium aestuarii TaxID=2998507 RepID=A0A9X3F3D8_9BACT|nr:hypothetical protein [Prolixibacteraceae bacterium Z1-6]